jgi:hypothetical protein
MESARHVLPCNSTSEDGISEDDAPGRIEHDEDQQTTLVVREVHCLSEMSILFIIMHLLSVLLNVVQQGKHTRVWDVLQEAYGKQIGQQALSSLDWACAGADNRHLR